MDKVSPGFIEFMHFMGNMIELKGWHRYRAGLDVTHGSTGEKSLFATWNDHEVMFHVAPLLPLQPKDPQQIERKRHIGNDVLVIVYHDSDLPYQIKSLTSKQTHIVCLVRPVKGGYGVEFLVKEGVPAFQPLWKTPIMLSKTRQSRELLLEKCINGIKAIYQHVPAFSDKIAKTRLAMLEDLLHKYVPESQAGRV
ncbi:hypothetical protein IWQ60_003927 [Tieghemiomyces parasiticus]|uniref:Rap-GAP domain-containing protein n=1 Tax=Tieghemiomyces parasiticus TaxID=78921 RepID=A0A9W8A9V3_9FUNG|nr:hypothetical protein IWQ60_003927 [Tieghemiomyces parasiticus]